MYVYEKQSKTILSKSKIYKYVLNPYVGCQFACSYCYARYMKRFSGHKEPWGEFVDVKINAHDLLKIEVNKKKADQVWISGVCDPYQPLEKKYELTRKCLKILLDYNWPVVIQTRSPLILRDIDLIKNNKKIDVGLSIATNNDKIRQLFEPKSPSISDRIETLAKLYNNGINTYAMIAPVLPGAEDIMKLLEGKVRYIYVDRMNYHHADRIFKYNNLNKYLDKEFYNYVVEKITNDCEKMGVRYKIV